MICIHQLHCVYLSSIFIIFQDKRGQRDSVEKSPENSEDSVMLLDEPEPQEKTATPAPRLYPEIPSAPPVTDQYTGEGLEYVFIPPQTVFVGG